MQKILQSYYQCLVCLKETGKDSIFYTVRTESVEFYIKNPSLSEWRHLLPRREEKFGSTLTTQTSTNHKPLSYFKIWKIPSNSFQFSALPPAESSPLSSSISLHFHSIFNFHQLLAPKSLNLSSFSSTWGRIHGFLLLIMN